MTGIPILFRGNPRPPDDDDWVVDAIAGFIIVVIVASFLGLVGFLLWQVLA